MIDVSLDNFRIVDDWAVPQKAVTALNGYGHVGEVAALVAFVAE
jgi:hypothetical protein